jgi:hypothetical protein
MTTRRDVVRAGFALSTLAALSPRAVLAGPRVDRPELADSIVTIADWAFAASAEFAHEVERYGLRVRGFDGDVGGLWLHLIERKVATGRVAVVGLTGPGVLFCLETLARAHGFGPVFRAERPATGVRGWPKVAASYTLAAAAATARSGGQTLAPFEHDFPCGAAQNDSSRNAAEHDLPRIAAERDWPRSAAEPRLLAWTLARDARRPAPLPT